MLNVIQKGDLVYFTGRTRTEYELATTQLVFSFPDLYPGEKVTNCARPFRALWLPKKEMYKKSILNFLPDLLYSGYTPTPTSLEEHIRILREVGQVAFLMGQDAITSFPAAYEVKYECDTWNGLEDMYGEKLVERFRNYLLLSTTDQEIVRKVWNTRRTREALTGNWTGFIDLLPPNIQAELRLFGEHNTAGEENSVLEFKKREQIGPELPNLKESIYAEFSLGEFLMEGANDVKERLEKIYSTCGIDRSPKAKDLEEFFVIIPCRVNGKRGFRIDFRK